MKRVIQIQQVSDLLKATHLESGRARTWTHVWKLVVLTIPHYCLGQSPGVRFWLVLPERFPTTFCTLVIPRGWDSISYKETLQLGSSGLPGTSASNIREKGTQSLILGFKEATHNQIKGQSQLTLHLLAFGEGIFWG